MKFKLKLKNIYLIIFALQGILFAQQDYLTRIVSDSIQINFDNHYSISQVSIIPNSETIQLRNKLLKKDDYHFFYSEGYFTLSDSLPYSIFDTLIVTYRSINLALKKVYQKRKLALKVDEITKDTLRYVEETSSGFSADEIFGPNLQKSGTIVRGFTVGTTNDFSLNSGLRLQLSGRISDEIEIVAALTDENTPIQPEGNTERLDELDKVFIQIKHKNASGTFGDYELNRKQGEFGFISRKLQGLMGEFHFENENGYVAIASSRGKFNTNNFNGQDGVQGPYLLSGINNEKDIIIIAGSEKVYVDGVEMKRGERNDYIIEYSNSRITFTPNRLITSASRITVDFEYTDRRYARNFFGTGIQSQFFDKKLGVQFQYIREGDNQDAPIDISLSDSDKKILAAAGDNRNAAAKSGVSLALPDSLGNIRGAYQMRDTLINNQTITYYVYSPGDSLAVYNVSFSFVGDGLGDYSRQSLGNYTFVGIKNGSYLPIIYLPLPELKQVGNLVVDLNLIKDVSLSLELAGSSWDQNRFSSIDDNNNFGYARNIFLTMNPKKVEVGNVNLGKIGFSYKDRFTQSKFTSADRINEIEFSRNYNLTSTDQPEDETLREANLTLIPVDKLNINSSYGLLKKGSNFTSNRYNNTVRYSDNQNINVNYNLDYVSSKNNLLKSDWLRQKGDASYLLWKLKPGVEFLAEDKKDHLDSDSLLNGSLRYLEVDPFLELVDLGGLNLSAKYSMRNDYLPIDGIMFKESNSVTQYYELRYSGIREVSSTLNFTLRNKKYTEVFKQQGNLDNQSILIRSQSKFNLWKPLRGDLYYEVSTQRSAKLQKVYVRVTKGTGNFKYLGDLNKNGIADDDEFEPAVYDGDFVQITIPTDQLYPVIDLKTSTRWHFNFKDAFDNNNLISSLLKPISTETFWRVQENSREEDYKKIYLLHFSAFQNPDKTIRGSNYIQQDVYLFENDQDLSIRLRYDQSKSLDQYSGGSERGYKREKGIRIKFRMIKEMTNQTEFINGDDNVNSNSSSNRSRAIKSNTLNTDFSYRPERNIEVGFKIQTGRSTDYYPATPTVIDLNSQTLRFNLSFAGTGRLRIEFERDELSANTTENVLPFELVGANSIGKNFYWRFNFDYRISSNLQSTISYDGRSQGKLPVIHTARAEVRAYF